MRSACPQGAKILLSEIAMADASAANITKLLTDVEQQTPGAQERLLDVVYEELRSLAAGQMRRERSDHTLQPTALVHEAYVRLMGNVPSHWQNRAHFFGAAAEVMRRILVDYARRRVALRRGGDRERTPLGEFEDVPHLSPEEFLAIDEALEQLDALDARKGQIVRMRFFAGLTAEETAAALGSSVRTVKREWRFARAWLYRAVRAE